MSDPSVELQDGVEAALRAHAGLKTAAGGADIRLYPMAAPNGAAFPYLTFGDDQVLPDETECAEGSECYVEVHVWARGDAVADSRLQCKAMAGQVRAALKDGPAIDGHRVVVAGFTGTRFLKDPDGLTAHAVVGFRYLTEPV